MKRKSNDLSAPKVDGLIEGVEGSDIVSDRVGLDLLLRIVASMERIKTVGDDELRKVWIEVPRGSLEDFGDFSDLLDEGIVKDHDGFVEEWLSYYPEESKWYELSMSKYRGQYFFLLGGKLSFKTPMQQVTPNNDNKLKDVLKWLNKKVDDVVKRLTVDEEGYNAHIRKNIPYRKRFGRILRSDHWEIFPEEGEKFRMELSRLDLDALNSIVGTVPEAQSDRMLKKMTARDFYNICSICYLSNGYDRVKKKDMTPKEMYQAMADGRDCALNEVDMDSEEAFQDWYIHGSHCGGHPWEICTGGNSTHISLYVHKEEAGWELILDGSSRVRVLETVKMALALRSKNIPIRLNHGDEIFRMVTGTDHIGIVPEDIFPRYCHSCFPKEDKITDFMNLGFERTEDIIKRAFWYPLERISIEVELGQLQPIKKKEINEMNGA